tara:strand:+ start:266 stop:700 length:435 start_codon:yes stop_codon:yes gene_type:complete
MFSFLRSKKPINSSRNEKSQAIVEFVVNTLGVQQELFLNEDETLPTKAFDEWSIGYVAGATDAVFQKSGFEPNLQGMSTMTVVFIKVFGGGRGPELFGEFMRLQEQGNQAVQDGMITGGRDIAGWMADNNKVPTGWSAYIHSLD